MRPIRLKSDDNLQAVLGLLTESFAYMEGRIDPPSSLAHMTLAALAHEAAEQEVWILPGPSACMILTPKAYHLYLGKLATAPHCRGQGLARLMVHHAERRAHDLGLPQIRLQTRIELVENHAAFRRLGFVEVARTAHAGYQRPTSVTFAKATGP